MLIQEPAYPFALEVFQVEIRGKRLAIKKVVAVLSRDNFLLPIPQYDFDPLPSQPMRFKEGSQVGSILTPIVDDNPFGMILKKVEAATPNDQPDDPIAIVGGQLSQALRSTLKNRLIGVLNTPLNGVSDGPGV